MLATMRKLRTSRPVVISFIAILGVAICLLPMACRAPAGDEHEHGDTCGSEDTHETDEHDDDAADEHEGHDHGDDDEHGDEEGAVIELDEHARELAGIVVATVEPGAFNEWIEVPGVLHANPDETAVVSAPVMGTVESVSANVGDPVRRGQTLVVLRCPELAAAQADVSTAASELAAAQQAMKRRQVLAAEGEFAAAPFEEARSAFLGAQQELRSAEADLKRVRRVAELGGDTQPALEDATVELADAREALRGAEADSLTAKAALATAERIASRMTSDTAGSSAGRPAAMARVAAAETALQTAVDNAGRTRTLLADGLATEQEAADGRASEAHARADLEEARLALRTTDTPSDEARLSVTAAEQEVTKTTSALDEAQQRLRVAQARYDREETIAREEIPSRAQLSSAESQLATARAAHDRARLAWEREQRLKQQDARSREALAELEGAVTVARSRLRGAERAVQVIGRGRQRSGGRIALTAPVSGKISSRTVSVGATAGGGEELMAIVGVRSIWVEAALYEKDISLVYEGQSMQVEIPSTGDRDIEIAIHSIDPGLDEHTRKATVRGMLDNASGGLLPDMFAKVRIRVGSARGIVAVPDEAVQSDSHCEFVFIEEAVGRYRQVDVHTGSRSGGRVEIIEGLEIGDRIVIEGAFLLKSEGSEISDSCGGH